MSVGVVIPLGWPLEWSVEMVYPMEWYQIYIKFTTEKPTKTWDLNRHIALFVYQGRVNTATMISPIYSVYEQRPHLQNDRYRTLISNVIPKNRDKWRRSLLSTKGGKEVNCVLCCIYWRFEIGVWCDMRGLRSFKNGALHYQTVKRKSPETYPLSDSKKLDAVVHGNHFYQTNNLNVRWDLKIMCFTCNRRHLCRLHRQDICQKSQRHIDSQAISRLNWRRIS